MAIPILDNHLHLDPAGLGVKAVQTFEKAGGTHIVLCHKPYSQATISSAADYQRSFKITLQLAQQVRGSTNVRVFVTLGPYPVELIHLSEKLGLNQAKDVMFKGMDLAAEYIRNCTAIAFGEIGRPHFEVSPEIWDASNEILSYGMELARELGCAVVLHTESTTPDVCQDLASMADSVRLARDKVVKHYSPPLVNSDLNHGLFPSVLASEKNISEAIKQGTRFMMETDYLDDLNRPGAVLGVKTVPKRTKKLLQDGMVSEEDVYTIHKENPEAVYGVEF
jgi:TatD-related deoxyribonuclease